MKVFEIPWSAVNSSKWLHTPSSILQRHVKPSYKCEVLLLRILMESKNYIINKFLKILVEYFWGYKSSSNFYFYYTMASVN